MGSSWRKRSPHIGGGGRTWWVVFVGWVTKKKKWGWVRGLWGRFKRKKREPIHVCGKRWVPQRREPMEKEDVRCRQKSRDRPGCKEGPKNLATSNEGMFKTIWKGKDG